MKPGIIRLKNIIIALLFAGMFTSCGTMVAVSYDTYTPPAWAPPYDDVSSVHYYYFPDYDMYYDVWGDQFWYNDNGTWEPSATEPYPNVDLYNSYIVLINKKYATPWVRHDYFVRNYPPHSYENYQNIVVNNRIIKNIQPNHDLVPRAFNENTNRVTFIQKPKDVRPEVQHPEQQPTQQPDRNGGFNRPPSQPQPTQTVPQVPANREPIRPQPTQGVPQNPINRQPQTQREPPPQQINRQPSPQPANNNPAPSYPRQAQEVPMRSIKPFMPQAAQKFNYGSGVKKKQQ